MPTRAVPFISLALAGAIAGACDAQLATSTRRFHAALGPALYDGAFNEQGIGLALLADAERPFWQGLIRLEAGARRYTGLGSTCTLSVPGGCSPEDPPALVLSAAAFIAAPARGALYSMLGLGVVGRSETRRHGYLVDLAAELGAGLRLGRRFDLQVRLLTVTGVKSGRAYSLVLRTAL